MMEAAGRTMGIRGREEENAEAGTGNLRKEELAPLRDALKALMRFVREKAYAGIPYFYHFLDYMKNNIEICMYTMEASEEDLKSLERILRRDWSAANDFFLGIPSCKLIEEGQIEQGIEYVELLEEVNQYFQPQEEVVRAAGKRRQNRDEKNKK